MPEAFKRRVTILELRPDHGRAEPGRRAQRAHVYGLAGCNVALAVDCSDGKRRTVVIDTADIDAVCAALQKAASEARLEWREMVAASVAYGAIHHAKLSAERLQ